MTCRDDCLFLDIGEEKDVGFALLHFCKLDFKVFKSAKVMNQPWEREKVMNEGDNTLKKFFIIHIIIYYIIIYNNMYNK